MKYVIGLTADPNHVNNPRFNIASGAAEELLAGRAAILGWHNDTPGDLLVDIFDESVISELKKADFVEQLPVAGDHPYIVRAEYIQDHEDDLRIGLTI